MRKILFFIILFSTFVKLFGEINGPGDFQIWVSELSVHKITERTRFTVFNEFRFSNDASEFNLYQTRFQYRYSPTMWMTLAPTYRQFFVKSTFESPHQWFTSFNPVMEVTFFLKSKWIELSQRNWGLFFINATPTLKNTWQYRNRLLLLTSWNFSKLQLSPILSDEVFFTERRGFTENRILLGLRAPLMDQIGFSMAYMLRSLKNFHNSFNQINVLTISLLFRF